MSNNVLDLRWILENLPVGVWVGKVPSGEVAYANPEFRAILGMDAVPGSQIGDAPATYGIFDRNGCVYPVDRLPFSRVAATGQPAIVDDIVIHRFDQGKINVRAFAYPVFDNSQQLTHVVIAFIDITAQVKAEVEREQTESRLALAVNHAPIVMWATDVNGVVTLSEGAGLTGFGVKSGDLVGQNLFAVYKDRPDICGYLRRGLSGESFWYTVQVNKTIYDTWLMPLRNAAGEITGAAGLSNNVSEVRTLQANAIQNDRAVALGTLAASVAHEINNPLTYMLGHIDLLVETLAHMEKALLTLPASARANWRTLTAQIRQSIDPVRAGTQRIALITRELQTFNGSAGAEVGRVDVGSVIESVLKLMRKEIEARATLELTLSRTAPVLAASARLIQVVMNLVVNAMQALPADRPQLNVISIRAGDVGSNVLIEVADNGRGVPLQDRERIFEPFVTTKAIGEGSGLGLFVCRNIVRDYGGSVTLDDRPGGGAIFRVELPAAHDEAQVTANNPTPTPPHNRLERGRGHVLVIDDELLVAQTLCRQLSAAGYRSSLEQNAAAAVEMLLTGSEDIDLVYCDLMMKTMSGMDLAAALVARAPLQLRKVVFMTGGAFTPSARAFCERHAEQCVEKPFDIVAETARRLRLQI